MAYDYVVLDVFTHDGTGGNPLAVLPHAEGLSGERMQAIAAEFGFSETTFVLPPDDPRHDARVRIFTPAHEMPFAGHPNVGTGYVLAQARPGVEKLVFEEIAGIVRVHVQRNAGGDVTGATVAAPRSLSIGVALPSDLVAACASLPQDALDTTSHDPLVASVGADFAFAALRDATSLRAAAYDTDAFRRLADAVPEVGATPALMIYARESPERIRARMFAPLSGVPEDPATGSAAAALAALLVSLAPGEEMHLGFEIIQGIELGRPCRILAEAHKSAEGGVQAHVGGTCRVVRRAVLEG